MPHLIVREEGPVVWATMNRPAQLNALNAGLVEELLAFFEGIYWRPEIRVVVFSGAGRAFCAGLDLKEHPATKSRGSVSDTLANQSPFTAIVRAMRRCPQPIIALVQGPASGVDSRWRWRVTCASPRRTRA